VKGNCTLPFTLHLLPEDLGKRPRQGHRILNTGVHALPARGAVDVGGIAREQEPAGPVGLRERWCTRKREPRRLLTYTSPMLPPLRAGITNKTAAARLRSICGTQVAPPAGALPGDPRTGRRDEPAPSRCLAPADAARYLTGTAPRA